MDITKNKINDALRLPIKTDEQKLLGDLQICLQTTWKEHYNTKDYEGSWTVLALRSQSGRAEDILAPDSEVSFSDTFLLKECHYFNELLNELQFEKETIRLLRLKPGSVIKEHRDKELAYKFGCFRLHIPIITDATVAFLVNGENISMKKGECWYADFDLPHSVYNDSKHDRIHMVIDGRRNKWTDDLFANAGYDFEEEERKQDYSIEVKKQMIESLRFIKTETAIDMIKKLELEIIDATK